MSIINKKPLIVLTGATAVGKTDLSVRLAKRIDGEIISADSIQVYKYMDIGSAKVTEDEMEGVRHYLVDELMPDEEFNIFVFQKLAKRYIEEIYKKGKVPIIVGGTGFYIQSLLYDVDFISEDNDRTYRDELEALAKTEGNAYLHDMLREVDSESADSIHENNVKRVIRALEYFHLTGEKISTHNKEQMGKSSPYDFKYYVLNVDRDILYKRIDERIDIMIENGLVDEVKGLLDKGYKRELVSMQGLGYKEIAAYLEGEYSLEEAVYILKRDTRHFAKRQLTWFRREKDVSWINYEEFNMSKDEILDFIIDDLKNILHN